MASCKTGQDYAGSQIIGERGSIKIGSISKLTQAELIMNSGERRIICGDTPKGELMGNEARAFYELIAKPEKNSENTESCVKQRSLSAARCSEYANRRE